MLSWAKASVYGMLYLRWKCCAIQCNHLSQVSQFILHINGQMPVYIKHYTPSRPVEVIIMAVQSASRLKSLSKIRLESLNIIISKAHSDKPKPVLKNPSLEFTLWIAPLERERAYAGFPKMVTRPQKYMSLKWWWDKLTVTEVKCSEAVTISSHIYIHCLVKYTQGSIAPSSWTCGFSLRYRRC